MMRGWRAAVRLFSLLATPARSSRRASLRAGWAQTLVEAHHHAPSRPHVRRRCH